MRSAHSLIAQLSADLVLHLASPLLHPLLPLLPVQVREMYAFSVALAMNKISTELLPPGQTHFIAQVGAKWKRRVAGSACGCAVGGRAGRTGRPLSRPTQSLQ